MLALYLKQYTLLVRMNHTAPRMRTQCTVHTNSKVWSKTSRLAAVAPLICGITMNDPQQHCVLAFVFAGASRVHSSSQLHHINLTAIIITSIITITTVIYHHRSRCWLGWCSAAHLATGTSPWEARCSGYLSAAARGRELPG